MNVNGVKEQAAQIDRVARSFLRLKYLRTALLRFGPNG